MEEPYVIACSQTDNMCQLTNHVNLGVLGMCSKCQHEAITLYKDHTQLPPAHIIVVRNLQTQEQLPHCS